MQPVRSRSGAQRIQRGEATVVPHARSRTWIVANVGIWTLVSGFCACHANPAPNPPPPPPPPAAPERFVFVQVHPHGETRFELTIDGAGATLVESDAAGSRTYRGSAREEVGARMLHLEMAGVQPLELRCARLAMTIDGTHV